MWSGLKDRQVQLRLVVFLLMIVLVGRLFVLTVFQKESWTKASTDLSIKTVYTSAPRGEIKDSRGRLIAGNRCIFVISLVAAEIEEENINNVALNLINLLESNGDKYNDDFPILIDEKGRFYYTYDEEIKEWLISQDFSKDLTAEEAFDALREAHGIDEKLDVYEAQSILQNTYGVYPPISVKAMEYTSRMELKTFLQSFGLENQDKDGTIEYISAEDVFYQLREKYKIDSNVSNEDARKILLIRNMLKNLGYKSYMPAEVASDVSEQTIITLEEMADSFPGVQINTEYIRYYPNGNTACHVIGYLGKISESQQSQYLEKGYSSTDLVGKEGIEKYYETDLKGQSGEKKIEVNAKGQQVSVISSQDSVPGNDVELTIDLELQKTAEEALKQALQQIQIGGTFRSKYGNYHYNTAYSNAAAGAVVAVDVNTGEVLALANYPGYDPNLFAEGITSEVWDSLQGQNPRDPLSPLPLYNVAAMTSIQPGSTFKPVTALAAIDAGWQESWKLYDDGAVQLGNRPFGCWVWNSSKRKHGYLDIRQALEVSCNYFFYDLGAGRDFYKDERLKIDIDIQDVMNYAEKLGLGSPTGIELAESAAGVPSEEKKIAGMKSSLKYFLKLNASQYFTTQIYAGQNTLNETLDTILSWAEENPSRKEIQKRLSKLGVRQEKLVELSSMIKSDYFNFAEWSVGDALNLAIGQGENAYTPIQLARYIATVANDGTLYDLTLTKSVEGRKIEKKQGKVVENSNPDAFQIVRDGMHLVTSGSSGTSRSLFATFPYQVGAKTGTAQKSGKINPPDEVEYIKKNLGRIAPGLCFEEVEKEMNRLLTQESEIYKSESVAVRRAVINLSDASVEDIDAYKDSYDNFSWFVAFAPVEKPEIAVSVLIFQGGSGGYSGPVAREILGKYMELQKEYSESNIVSTTDKN